SWGELTSLLGRTWPHAHGARLGIAKLAVDTGYQAPAVYAWARGAGFAQVAPVKGVEGFNRAAPVAGPSFVDATERGRKIRRGARLWTIAVATFKSETYRSLRLAAPTDEDIATPGLHPSPAGRGSRMDQAAGRRAAGDRDDAARLPETRVAEAAGTQRGVGLPGLRARRRLDCRSGSVVRSEVAEPRGPARACARPNRGPSRRR